MRHDVADRLDAIFLALADRTRRALLARLALGQASVTVLAAPFTISQPAISRHLKILERAGLITVGRDAQRRPRRLAGEALREASAWIEKYRARWEASVARREGVRTPSSRPSPVQTRVPERSKR